MTFPGIVNPTVPFLVHVSGLPAAGKSTIANTLGSHLGLPVICGDTIKESIFDAIGYSSRDWSSFLSLVSREVSLAVLPQIGPCIWDVFMPRAQAERTLPPAAAKIIEIHCSVPYETAWQRFVERADGGDRHPGHVDQRMSFDFFKSSLLPQQVDAPYGLAQQLLTLDTSSPVEIAPVAEWLRQTLLELGHRADDGFGPRR